MLDLLIVDDSAGSRLLIERALRKAGPVGQCYQAASGQEALAVLARSPVHLVITDLNMEGMDGRALVRAMRARASLDGTRIAVLTSEDTPEVRAELARLGSNYFLAKPLTPASMSVLFESAPAPR